MSKSETNISTSLVLSTILGTLKKDGQNVSEDAIVCLDSINLSKPEELTQVFEKVGIEGLLLNNVDDKMYDLIFHAFGGRPEKTLSDPYLMILKSSSKRSFYHLISWPECPSSQLGALRVIRGEVTPSMLDLNTLTNPKTEEIQNEPIPDIELLQFFAETVARNWKYTVPTNTMASSGDNEATAILLILFTQPYSYKPYGDALSSSGYTPPSNQTINLSVTYNIKGLFNQTANGSTSQYIISEIDIWVDPSITADTSKNKGWGNASLEINTIIPSNFSFVSGSPANINGETDVTTTQTVTVGVNKDGGNASYSYSQSVTKKIYDWGITMTGFNQWLYHQYQPFHSNYDDIHTSSVASSNNNLHSWPDITKFVLDVDTMATSVIQPSSNGTFTFGWDWIYSAMYAHISTADNLYMWWSFISMTPRFTVNMRDVKP